MASELDICNLALSRLGDSATLTSIDPPEGSVQAEHCAKFYPIARDSLLEKHTWNFATKRRTLAALDTETWNWSYAYAKPNDAIKLIAVLPATAGSDEEGEDYEVEVEEGGADAIFTNLEDATLRYIFRLTDTARFSPLFVDALSWLLASHIAGPLLKGDAGAAAAKASLTAFKVAYTEAVASDANQRKVKPEHTPGWIAGR